MSVELPLSAEIQRLLDNNWVVVLYKNDLGSYTAAARKQGDELLGRFVDDIPESRITDHFTACEALGRLPEKVFGCNQEKRR